MGRSWPGFRHHLCNGKLGYEQDPCGFLFLLSVLLDKDLPLDHYLSLMYFLAPNKRLKKTVKLLFL